MKINLKTTVIFSTTLAVLLNIWQFASSYQQREAAFAPAFATTASLASTTSQATATLTPLPIAAVTPVATPSPSVAPVANPAAATVAASLADAGLKPEYASLYLAVQHRYGTPWEILAAVHETETGQSGSTDRTSYAGAEGPMQFMPATFNHYAVDADGNGADITDLDDAMYTAGRYLAADGAADGNYTGALYGYNHSDSYVSHVLGIADNLGL